MEEPLDLLEYLDSQEGENRFVAMCVLADFLEDQGNPLAIGWRWLAGGKRKPQCSTKGQSSIFWFWLSYNKYGLDECQCTYNQEAHLPKIVMYSNKEAIKVLPGRFRDEIITSAISTSGDIVNYDTRLDAEKAAVRAYLAYLKEEKGE